MKKRIVIFFCIILFCAVGMIGRTTYLCMSPELTETASKQQTLRLTLEEERAQIYDCNGNSFVNNAVAYRAVALPNPTVVDDLIALGCPLSREELASMVENGNPFVTDVSYGYSDNPNIHIYQISDRYSENSLAVHTIGYCNSDGDGVSGIEKAYNDFLKENGQTIDVICSLDGLGNYLKGSDLQVQTSGSNSAGVVLTLDMMIQDIVERAGSGIEKGAIVVLDAPSGEIRAMASFPSFSPNDPAAAMNDEELAPMINRVLSPFAVGSTFKISTAAAALESGISPSLSYTCTGEIDISGQIFHCHNRDGHGTLQMQDAFVDSCNPYFINLGMMTGATRLRQMASDLGFGREIVLADGMVSDRGTLPSLETLQNPGQLANFSFGQGDLMGTPLQVAEMILSVVRGGSSVSPTLVKGTTTDGMNVEPTGQEAAPIQAMSQETAAQIREFMEATVLASDKAQPVSVTAGGKSATAQTGRYDENGNEIYDTWFCGYFPAEEPQYVVAVLVEGGESGTGDAGPIFSSIADGISLYERTLGQSQ